VHVLLVAVALLAGLLLPEEAGRGERPAPERPLHVFPASWGGPTWVSWAPGSTIVFRAGPALLSIDREGRTLRWLRAAVDEPVWSPSGKQLLVAADGSRWTFLLSADGRHMHRIRSTYLPSWSPHGDRLAFFWGGNVATVKIDGSSFRFGAPTFFGANWHSAPKWSPDGRQMIYAACVRPGEGPCDLATPGRDSSVFVARVDRLGPGRLIGRGQCPDWSSRGYLAYETKAGVVVSRADGSAGRVAFGDPLQCVSWSPDGRWVAGETKRGLVIADLRGTRLVARLPSLCNWTNYFMGSPPAWSPNGKWIAVPRQVGCLPPTERLYVVRVRDGQTRVLIRSLPPRVA
jgi:Tol biopolymer transport system component